MTSERKKIFLATVVLNSYMASSFGNTADAGADGGGGSLYSVVVSLVLILGAAAAATVFLRRWKGSIGRREGPMQLQHVIALGPRERLALVKVGRRYLVVGVTPTSITKVADLSGSLEDEPSAPVAERRQVSGPEPGAAGPSAPEAGTP